MSQNMSDILSQFASTLGTTTRYLWSVEVKESYVMAGIHMVWVLLLIVVSLISLYIGKKSLKKAKVDNVYGNDFEWTAASWLSWIVIIICIVFVGLNLTSAIGCVLNPQDYAFSAISSVFH